MVNEHKNIYLCSSNVILILIAERDIKWFGEKTKDIDKPDLEKGSRKSLLKDVRGDLI